MANKVLTPWPKFSALDANGDALNSGKLNTYVAGTSTPKDTFDAQTGSTNANPVVLDSRGEADVWLESGSYKFVLTDSLDNTIWTVDNIDSSVSFQRVDTIAALKALDGDANTIITVTGYSAAGDGGGGTFYWDASSTDADDGGIILMPDSTPATGRWVRLWDDRINAKWFGCVGDGATDDATNLGKIITYVSVSGQESDVLLDNGDFKISSNLTWPKDSYLRFSGDGRINVDGGVTLTVNCPVDENCLGIFAGTGSFVFGEQVAEVIHPNWFGAVGDGTTNDATAINLAITTAAASELKTIKFKPGTYVLETALAVSQTGLKFEGSSPEDTIIKNTVNTIDVFTVSGDDNRISNLGITTTAGGSNIAIQATSGDDIYIDNCVISNFQDGIDITTANNIFVSNVKMDTIARYGVSAANSSNDVYFKNCYIDGTNAAASIGIRANSVVNMNYDGVVKNFEWAVELQNASSLNYNGSMDTCVQGAVLFNGTNGTASFSAANLYLEATGTEATYQVEGTSNTCSISVLKQYLKYASGNVPAYVFEQNATAGVINAFIGSSYSDTATYDFGGAKFNNIASSANIIYMGSATGIQIDKNQNLMSIGLNNSGNIDIAKTKDLSSPKITITDNDVQINDNNLEITTVGKGLDIKEGSDARMGTGTLSTGTVTISTTAVTTNSRIFVTNTATSNSLFTDTIVDGVSFDVSGSGSDTFNWLIINPS